MAWTNTSGDIICCGRLIVDQSCRRYRRVIGEEDRQGTLLGIVVGVGLLGLTTGRQQMYVIIWRKIKTEVANNLHAGGTQAASRDRGSLNTRNRVGPYETRPFPACARLPTATTKGSASGRRPDTKMFFELATLVQLRYNMYNSTPAGCTLRAE